MIIREGGWADEGGKEFTGDDLDEGCNVWGVKVVQVLEFVEINLVGTLATKNVIDRCITIPGGGKKCRRRLMRNVCDFARL